MTHLRSFGLQLTPASLPGRQDRSYPVRSRETQLSLFLPAAADSYPVDLLIDLSVGVNLGANVPTPL